MQYSRDVTIWDEKLTVAVIARLVEDHEWFEIFYQDGGLQSGAYLICIHGERLETDNEMTKRIEREEKYMENYNKFHQKHKK